MILVLKQKVNKQLFQAVKSTINQDPVLAGDESKGENYFQQVVRKGLLQDVTSVLSHTMSQPGKAPEEDAFGLSEQVTCCQRRKATHVRAEQRPAF